MSKEKRPITTYYALFFPSGPAGSGKFAGGNPTERVDSFQPEHGVGTVFLFSTSAKATEHRRWRYNDTWQVMPLTLEQCQAFLIEAKQAGIFTDVSLNPTQIIITAQPIDKFLALLPYRTHSDD